MHETLGVLSIKTLQREGFRGSESFVDPGTDLTNAKKIVEIIKILVVHKLFDITAFKNYDFRIKYL